MRVGRMLPFLAAWLVGSHGLPAQEGEPWIFEGVISVADPALAPDLQSGWVLAGSFLFSSLEMEPESAAAGERAGRLAGGIAEGELTIDLYYQLHFEAYQVPGLAGFDFHDDDPEADGRDLYSWFIPMQGSLKETDWESRWLQIWLADPEGDMIRTVPPRVSPYGIEWKTGWFRLGFENAKGETAYVDGRLEIFSPEAALSAEDEAEQWRGVALELSELLRQRDAALAGMRSDLAQARDRMAGLQRMMDLLVEERSHLQEENARLQEQASLADPSIREKIADLTAQKSLLEQSLQELQTENQDLSAVLEESEADRRRIERQLASLQEAVEAREQPRTERRDERPHAAVQTVVPPTVILEPPEPAEPPPPPPPFPRPDEGPAVPQAQPVEPTPESLTRQAPEESVSPNPVTRARRFGPRKFR